MEQYEIVATSVFKLTLARFSAFLTRKYSKKLSSETRIMVKAYLKEKLTTNPYLAPPSERLLDLGIKNYRQLTIDSHNLVFYQVDESSRKIILLAIMDSRQDVKKLLHEVNLLIS